MNSGRIGGRGIEEILKLQAHPDLTKILCIHHHLVPIPNTGRERSTIQDAGNVIDVAFDAGIDIVLTGHRHHPHWYTLIRGGQKLTVINSGTFSANKTRALAGHSFVIIKVENDQLDIRFQGTDEYSPYQLGVQSSKTLSKGVVGPGPQKHYPKELSDRVLRGCSLAKSFKLVILIFRKNLLFLRKCSGKASNASKGRSPTL
ncbi:MAG: hypothetical protein ACXACI_18245 [Candidatus Hodarchaeales archaeon]